MAGKLFYKALSVLVFLVSLVLFILNGAGVAGFDIFNIKVCAMILIGGLGIVSLLKALTSKQNVYLTVSALLITAALILAGLYFEILPQGQKWLYIPIGIGLLLVFLFFRYLFNIRKWDAGDNERLGYKNFRERQAEKEKEELDGDIKELQDEMRKKDKEKAILMMDIEEKQKQKEEIKKKK